MAILTFSLQSGSNGNSIYVETPDVRLLFDAGISGRQAQQRMAVHGRDIRDCDALIVSHDHADHIRAAGIYSRKFDLPVLISRATLDAARVPLGEIARVEHFIPGRPIRFGHTFVETLPTPHDGADGCAFIVRYGNTRLGILTDLGHVFAELADAMTGLDAAYLESNYDPHMLRDGWYPPALKARIAGPHGHLANRQAGELAERFGGRLRWLTLSHLSEENNEPRLAMQTVRQALTRPLPVFVASRYEVGEPFDV